ncbi:ribonuclease I [Acinetobacter sp.]|jgi:ribonuclease T2|uniref:ribonuclease T2 family protein n=1 Tax=Acinetobacter sp. TaxID=472 RepID=UPI0035AD9A5E
MRLINGRTTTLLQASLLAAGGSLVSSAVFSAPVVHGYMMNVQLVPAVCSLDPQRNKKRKCMEGYSLNITGLYPETNALDCFSSSAVKLSPIQAKVVARVMPDENARNALWHDIGGCVPMNASQYFRTIITYAEKLKIPEELTSQETRQMQAAVLRNKMMRLNSSLPANGVQFSCQPSYAGSILTDIKICYKSNGVYKSCTGIVSSSCPPSFTIKGSF